MCPVSTLSFLYTDIEGSTRLWERQPDEMRAAMERHNTLLRQTVESNGGCIFRTAGDAICASFPSAPAAVATSVQAQRQLHAESWELESPIRVRMALHTGEVEQRGGDFVGPSLNHIGRLLAACHGGQIVMTLVTEQLAGAQLPPGARLVDLGQYHLRDIDQPEHIFQVSIDGLPANFPPLKSLEQRANNLPVQMSSFVGRERELEEIHTLLESSRLLTLTGPGGTGKTRLAIQVATNDLAAYPDGAWFIELAPITDPALIFQALASVLCIPERSNQPLERVTLEILRPQKLLLVLDNCEHLLEACAQVCDTILKNCPGIKIITSSREMLGISGESIFRVPPLTLPEAEDQASLDEISKSEAVRLFVERARAIQPGFSLNSQNAASVAKICQRLDGIPLAIELAAARVSLFGPEQIATRLDDRFRLLTGGSRTALPRQQTLEALFDWSHDLLSPEERAFFRRSSVFSGGWIFEAAEAVCLDPEEQGSGPDALELLSQLINKSLVVVDSDDAQSHYHLLETTRQYAQKKLLEAGEASEARTRHMQYYARLAKDHWPLVRSSGFGWFLKRDSRLYSEQDNFRAAQNWALDTDLRIALEFAGTVAFLWSGKSQVGEIRSYIREVLKRIAAQPDLIDETAPEVRTTLAYAWLADASFSENLGQNLDALHSAQKGVEYAQAAGDLSALSLAYIFQAEAAGLTGDAQLAYASGEESIRIARQLDSKWHLTMTLTGTAAYALIPLGDIERARQYADEAALYTGGLSDPRGEAFINMVKGSIDVHDGHYEAAREQYTKSLAGFQASSDPYFATVSRSGLADVARKLGEDDLSRGLYVETIESWSRLGNYGAVARCLECIAFIAIHQAGKLPRQEQLDHLKQAATLFGAADGLRQANRASMNPIEQVEVEHEMQAFQSQLGDDPAGTQATQRSRAEGRAMELAQIVRWLKGL